MIAFSFTFPGGRYHATPWGRHVNEADVAWPPEPARILRALIATWWRKGDHAAFEKFALDDLIDALAADLPVFHLPEAVHSHIRAFMPAPLDKRLIFDGFLKVHTDAPLIVAWPKVSLEAKHEALVSHLLDRLGYLGRAESWAQARLTNWDGVFNAALRPPGGAPPRGSMPVDIMAARTADEWREERTRQLRAASALKGGAARKVIDTLPECLCDAIAIDTGQWQAAGWSTPPALRKVVYDRPEIGPMPQRRSPRTVRDSLKTPERPEVARFLLAGHPQPRVEDTLRIGEVLRRALMARCPDGVVPQELSGRGPNGPLREDSQHGHAFYLPEDADGDGAIDHLVVWSRVGFSDAARRAFDRLTLLYVSKGSKPHDDESADNFGRREWRVALDQVGAPEEVRGSRLLDPARKWVSATPYLNPRYGNSRKFDFAARVEDYRAALRREWFLRRRADAELLMIEPVLQNGQDRFGVGPKARSPLLFARTRSRGLGGLQPDVMGASLTLSFDTPIHGPMAFGKHAHFGLGLFTSEAARS